MRVPNSIQKPKRADHEGHTFEFDETNGIQELRIFRMIFYLAAFFELEIVISLKEEIIIRSQNMI